MLMRISTPAPLHPASPRDASRRRKERGMLRESSRPLRVHSISKYLLLVQSFGEKSVNKLRVIWNKGKFNRLADRLKSEDPADRGMAALKLGELRDG